MTKVILVPDNKVLTEIDDGNPDGTYEVDYGHLPYGDAGCDAPTWQEIYDKLMEILEIVDYSGYKKFYDQISELADYAIATAKLDNRRLQSYYADYFKEVIAEQKAKPRKSKSSILRFE